MNWWHTLLEGRYKRLVTYPPVPTDTIDREIELSRQERERIERLLETAPSGPTGNPVADAIGGRHDRERGH